MQEQKPVVSSNVKTAAYDNGTSTLYLEFHSGRRYRYFDVPRQIYDNIFIAPSAGRYVSIIAKSYRGEEY